jgi:RHS repeat-associated protein
VTSYGYDAQNKRVFTSGTYDSNGNATGYTVMLYSPGGQKLGTYRLDLGSNLLSTQVSGDIYFGSRRVSTMDRLGSVGKFYPYGEAKGGTNPADTWSFATYWRDSATNLDYADQRYYSNQGGRFMTPDPYKGSSGGPGDPNSPQSWNPYAYTSGDPVNRLDPYGLYDCSAPLDDSCDVSLANNALSNNLAMPQPEQRRPPAPSASAASAPIQLQRQRCNCRYAQRWTGRNLNTERTSRQCSRVLFWPRRFRLLSSVTPTVTIGPQTRVSK